MNTRRALLAGIGSAIWMSRASAAEPIRVGYIATMSGPQGAIGTYSFDAFMLGLDEAGRQAADRGDQGRRPVKVDVAAQAAQNFIGRDKVDLVVASGFSNVLVAIQKPINAAGRILISAGAGPTPLSGAGCDPLFFNASTSNENGPAALAQLMNQKGLKRVFAMAPNYQAGHDTIEGFKRNFKGEVIGIRYTTLDQPDYQAELSEVRAAKPDGVFAFYFGAMSTTFMRQYRQAGLGSVPIYTYQIIDSTTLPSIGDAGMGAHLAQMWNTDFDNAASKRFVAAYRDKYRRDPTDYDARNYDTARLMVTALKATGGSTEPTRLRSALRSVSFDSVRSKFSFNLKNQYPVQDYYEMEVVRGADGKPQIRTVRPVAEMRSDAVEGDCKMPAS